MSIKFNVLKALVLLYFCIPKWDIINIPVLPTGVRIQDLISVLLFLNSNVLTTLSRVIKKRQIFYTTILIFFFNFIGSLIFETHLYFLVGWIRMAQYLILGIAIYLALRHSSAVLYYLMVIQISVAALQYLKILPVFDPGRGILKTSEYAGTFGTAAELAYFSVFMTAIFVQNSKVSLANLSLFLPLFNGVRAYFIMIPVFVFIRTGSLNTRLLITIPALVASVGIYLYFSDLLNQFIFLTIELIQNIEPNLDSLQSSLGVASGDLALSHRIGKWAASLAIISQTSALFWGTGLYSAGGALDGGLLRLILELGVPASLLIFCMLLKLEFSILLLFLVVNLFFDGYLSSVVMPMIFAYILLVTKFRR